MTRRPVALALWLALVARADVAARAGGDGPPAAPPAVREVTGDLVGTTTWSGAVLVHGRARVPEGSTLRIEPGTRVLFTSAPGEAGAPAVRGSLEVSGSLVARGEPGSPVRFGPLQPLARDPLWLGLLLLPALEREVRLAWCAFEGADAAVQAGTSDARIEDCAFARCVVGVGVGVLWEGPERILQFTKDAAPVIERSRFAHCADAVSVEHTARPDVLRCWFLRCGGAVFNGRRGLVFPIRGLGARVDRCEVIRCRVGVGGPARVTNSIFEACDRVFEGSDFHDRMTAEIDRALRTNNLLAGDASLTASDLPIGRAFLATDAGRRTPVPGDLEDLDALLADGVAWSAFVDGSPALRAATDGGDLGVRGEIGARAAEAPPAGPPGPLVVPRWLALGPTQGLADVEVAKVVEGRAAKPPSQGDLDGDRMWALLEPAEAADVVATRRVCGGSRGERVLLATAQASKEADVALSFGYDGRLEAWWNGAPVRLPEGLRRFLPDDRRATLRARKGVNVLLLRHVPRAETGRLEVALAVSEDVAKVVRWVDAATMRSGSDATVLAVRSAVASVEKDAQGAPTGGTEVRLILSRAVHWDDATRADRFVVRREDGNAFDGGAVEARALPATRAVRLVFARALPSGAYRVELGAFRDPGGRPLKVAPAGTRFEVP